MVSPALSETITIDSVNLINVNMSNVTKLTGANFLMWSRQIHALLNGYGLASHIDGMIEVPPPTITADGVVAINHALTAYQRQDQLIYSSLLGAITISVQPILATTSTSAQIWEKLSATYAKPSRGHIQQLRQQIKQWKNGTKSIDDYLQGFTTRFDQLALLGKAIDLEDQIEYIIDGLSDEYKVVADHIQSRDVPPSLTEIHEKLLNHEIRLQSMTPTLSPLPVSANAASFRPSNNNRGQTRNNQNNPTLRLGSNNNTFNLIKIRVHVGIKENVRYVGSLVTVQGVVLSSRHRATTPTLLQVSIHRHQPHGSNLGLTWQQCHTIRTTGYLIVEPLIT